MKVYLIESWLLETFDGNETHFLENVGIATSLESAKALVPGMRWAILERTINENEKWQQITARDDRTIPHLWQLPEIEEAYDWNWEGQYPILIITEFQLNP